MSNLLRKIAFPAAVVALAAAQTFGMDLGRVGWSKPETLPLDSQAEVAAEAPDTVIYKNKIYTKFRAKGYKSDDYSSFADDSTAVDDSTMLLTARDTIVPPDSLRETDPFRFKYYVAILDSLTHRQVRDSLRNAGDSLDWPRLDSLYFLDSARRAKEKFEKWYNSLDKEARKRYDFEQKMKRRQRELDSTFKVKDSLQAIRDSILENTPRILETFALPDSLWYKRIVAWRTDPLFNNLHAKFPLDTGYNYYFDDYPFQRKDLGSVYLGVAGSPTLSWDYFKRGSDPGGLGDGRGNDVDGLSFYKPLEIYSYSPATLPMYNTKTPYTELSYWGTLFANTENEEANLHILTTQNIFPSLNFSLGYDRQGSNGMLAREDTDNRTFHASVNYLGKRYAASGGYIYNKVRRSENGGVGDTKWIRDTLVGSREIDVRLSSAESQVKKNTFFLNQTYRIPFTFIEVLKHRGDTTWKKPSRDSLDTDITTAFIGHNSEFTTLTRTYTDAIAANDALGRSVYDAFYLNPAATADSLRVMTLENKFFIRLQPWKAEAVVSTLNVGIGNRLRSHYTIHPEDYLKKPSNTVWNSTYLYGGVSGQIGRGIRWGADGYFTFLGQEIGDFGIDAHAQVDFYPFRRARKSPVSLSARFSTSLDEPEFFAQHYYSNHYRWDNEFSKISQTKITGRVDIPYWRFGAEAGYSLLANNIYFTPNGVVAQNATPVSIVKAAVQKDFALGILHLDNKVLFQTSSNQEVLPLPTLALNLRWYIQFNVVKDVMQMQIGANGLWTTKWYMPAYNPALGVFTSQDRETYGGGSPYVDAFVNIQWKRACIFVKLINANMGWPMEKADYFSADRYIRSQRAVKFGIYWPFYMGPNRNASVGSKAGSGMGGSGGGRSSGGLGNSLGGGLNSLRGGGLNPGSSAGGINR